MKQFEVESLSDLSAKLNQLRHLAQLGFGAGLEKAYLVISRDSLELRSNDQNKLLWPLLNDFSKQVEHYGEKYSAEDWKDILTSAFEGCMRFGRTLDGRGMIAFGAKTSKYSKKKFSEFIEFIYAEGSERGVMWSDKSNETLGEVRA